ncbi:hypothetical protein [Mucilaginibacter myungsuensis]|uniref:Uncharacterized protein n=1 Tax=Mucilaginibacter myungsuensis TaxID=649104 RepID=A0A929L1K4_9SPHI|nr:hypothetical protein [Mucilaginibacter myungsuensis]MBE9664517.1 hypothetical protein [Mucilaginibacter myungsuensis]MDN3601338.1 hypothetical protein [Mucilaginibacter myungsuensis]
MTNTLSKKHFLPPAIAGAFVIASLFTCNKTEQDPCEGIINAQPLQAIELQFQDKQKRDLFNKNTPNFIDTAYIKGYNPAVQVIAAERNLGYPGKTTLVIPVGKSMTYYLKLSATDTDTLFTDMTSTRKNNCAFDTRLTAFKYNNTSHADSVGKVALYTIVK